MGYRGSPITKGEGGCFGQPKSLIILKRMSDYYVKNKT